MTVLIPAAAIPFVVPPLHIRKTNKFSVLERNNDETSSSVLRITQNDEEVGAELVNTMPPIMDFADLVDANNQELASKTLWSHLEKHGYIILTVSRSSLVARIIQNLQETIENDFFPAQSVVPEQQQQVNCGGLKSGDYPYISERGVPMYRLGYEHCDCIREAYRVHCGSPDSQPWPSRSTHTAASPPCSSSSRQEFLRCMCVCRYICDVALKLTLGYDTIKARRIGSGVKSWKSMPLPSGNGIRNANNDCSNHTVVPYYARPAETKCGRIVSPTQHRVIAPNGSKNATDGRRRIVTIYEQKYEEYFPPPLLD